MIHQTICSLFLSLGYENVVEILIQNGADINAEEIDKWTPLHLAVQIGNSYNMIKN